MFLIYYTGVAYKPSDKIRKNVRPEIRLTNYESQQLEEAIKRGMSKSELIRSLTARLPAPSFKAG